MSEERRLAYVGMTRAQDKLYLTRTALRRYRGRSTLRTPSRFLAEIPEDLLVERDAQAEARQPVAEDDIRAFFRTMAEE